MKKESFWEKCKHYLGIEIGIEYKACLYFYSILVFYCCYRLLNGIDTASILHMAEIVLCNYLMGYIQVYLLNNFDEAERFDKKVLAGTIICAVIYTAVSFLFGWFDRNLLCTVIFAVFMLFTYSCVYLVNKIKREWGSAQLNDMLAVYKEKKLKSRKEDQNE